MAVNEWSSWDSWLSCGVGEVVSVSGILISRRRVSCERAATSSSRSFAHLELDGDSIDLVLVTSICGDEVQLEFVEP